MSALEFKAYCCQCMQPLRSKTGIVMSCGDFLCGNCFQSGYLRDNLCPGCKEHIQSVSLHNAPDEITKTLEDPVVTIEALYDTMKFQVAHYKGMLERAGIQIASLNKSLDTARM